MSVSTTIIAHQKEREDRDDKILRMLRTEDGKEFVKWLNEQSHREMVQLKGARDPIDIGRCQGRLDVLDRILRMKEE